MKKRDVILVVDDQRFNRQILNDLLKEKYELMFAEDGKKALNMIIQYRNEISIVLLDLVMPVFDGLSVLEELGKDRDLKKIPVIVVSQDETEGSELKALQMGAVDFIKKPFKAEFVRHKVDNMVAFRRTSDIVNLVKKDSLTALYNKEYFFQQVEERFLKFPKEQYDMIAVNIEQFKLINDSQGTREGDKLLKYIADIIKKECQNSDSIYGRITSDHFAILHPRDMDYVEGLASRLAAQAKQYPLKTKIVLKIGVYEIEDKTMLVAGMCDRAFLAANAIKGMYTKHYSVYDDEIRKKLLAEQYISSEMSNSLEDGQFQIYLQPKYALYNERIAGAEALIRWHHPEKGFMSPGEFIPLFEKNGFITEIDNFVWEKTCELISNRLNEGKSCVPISVNVSRKDLYNENLPEVVKGMTRRYGIDPKYLHLEITETSYTENPEQLVSVVSRLKQEGFSIEMDDFGSGYSSLNMLSELPIDILKLDIKFIENETEKVSNSRGILGFVINLAKWMNLTVVSEGVETKTQLDVLKNLECDYVQGYYFAKPMPAEQFFVLLDSENNYDSCVPHGQAESVLASANLKD